ncbi:uncharacterized protein J8A68_002131 [[Candida] subhashii]|uniref:Amino acid permease/ SLC12A domain-containing protein n=1 Tax=[Candida] subhashii TaxID=561895 RepID=A0A8J5QE30_9ASCO|nr:uncharacterized protein J8A68_002131 [[Candida] subhashii]KAG7664349.1 hypothetical protein J8A68_002131 [[Candida] subhashii]
MRQDQNYLDNCQPEHSHVSIQPSAGSLSSSSLPSSYTYSEGDEESSSSYEEKSYNPKILFHNFIDSFKPFDYSKLPPIYFRDNKLSASQLQHDDQTPPGIIDAHISSHEAHNLQFDYSALTDLERDALVTANSPLSRHLKTRHLTLISLGAAIGSGLFVGSGTALSHAGPLGLFLVWVFMATIVFATLTSLSELATAFPISGAFATFITLFIDSSVGFAIAWNYALQWLIALPLQLIAAAMSVQFWNPSIHPAIFVTIFYLVIVFINLFGVRGYGEAESILSIIKIIAVVGFNILAVVIVTGGIPGQPYIGAKNWKPPAGGLFNAVEPFKQMCYILASASFAYIGTELFALAGVESRTPKKSINRARLHILYRISLFYLVSIIMIGFLVPYTSPNLQTHQHMFADVAFSPFVIAIENAHIRALPSILNVVIIITVLSVGNASVYAASRVMCALGSLRQGPNWLHYIDRKGRPMGALTVSFSFGLLAYLVCIQSKTFEIFTWLLSLSGLSAIFTYLFINICHLRFRAGLSYRARDPKTELIYCASIYYSWYGVITCLITLVLQFWAALFPPGEGKANATTFFEIYLCLPLIFFSWLGHKIYMKKTKGVKLTKLWLTAAEMDVDTGRREVDLEIIKQEVAEENALLSSKPWYVKVYRVLC